MKARDLFMGGVINLRTCMGLERALGKEAWLRAEDLRRQADAREEDADEEEWRDLQDAITEARGLLQEHTAWAEAAEKMLDLTNW